MTVPLLRVCLIAPVPPPYGGISNWARLVQLRIDRQPGIALQTVNISPRWRSIDDLVLWKRMFGGALQFIRDFALFCVGLLRRPHVVHLTTSGQLAVFRDLVILAVARLACVPAIYHIRFGRIPQIARSRTWEWRVMALAIRMASAVIAIDAETAVVVHERFPRVRLSRIPNGAAIDCMPHASSDLRAAQVLFLGWVIPNKGVTDLVKAWVDADLVGWQCAVAGPGADTIRQALIAQYRPTNLVFLPEQPHEVAMQLMADSDVFVLPSHTEGFPNVVIEAMALGKAIVASSVGAIPEMLAGECGVLVPPQDSAALTKALRSVCSDSALRERLGARAREKAHREYDINRVIEQLVSLWRDVADANAETL